MIFAVVGMVVALLAAAMAIDVGSVIWRKRDLQVVADLAATDAAQQIATLATPTLADAQLFVGESAERNGFDVPVSADRAAFDAAGGNALLAEMVFLDPVTSEYALAAPAAATAVRTTAKRLVEHTFAPGSGSTGPVQAIASFTNEPRAAFSIGSKLASLDTKSSSVLGPVLTQLLGVNPALNAGVITYEGLASSTVTLGDLAAELGFATVDELLAGNVTVPQLADASAQILDREGNLDSELETLLGDIAVDGDSSLDARAVAFGSLVDVEQGQGDAAASMGLNVLDLLTSAGQRAQVANGTTFLTVPLAVTIPSPTGGPGLASSSLRLDLIQPPVISAFGPVGTQARTAQIDMTLTTRIEVSTPRICVLFLCIPRLLAVDLPIVVTGAQAIGTIDAIRCALPETESEVDVEVVTSGGDARATARASILDIGLDVADAGPIYLGPDVTNPPLTFPGPGDPSPMTFPSVIQSTTGAQTLATSLITDANLSLVGLNAGALLGLIEPVTEEIDRLVLNPLFDALGLAVGGADVRTLGVECEGGTSRLVR